MSHAVIVCLQLSDDQFGRESEREAIFAFEDQLAFAIERPGLGEFDGNEFGGGECTLYMYGDSADRLYNAIRPILEASPLARGAFVTKRYGEASDRTAGQVNFRL